MPSRLTQSTPLGQLWQLLSPDPSDFGKNFETEIKRLGVLGLQFASFVAIVLSMGNFFFDFVLWYIAGEKNFAGLVFANIDKFGIFLIGLSGLSLSRTSFGGTRANWIAIGCIVLAEIIATISTLLRASTATYPAFVISLLVLSVVVPLRPILVAVVGLVMLSANYALHMIVVESSRSFLKLAGAFPASFFSTIILVCTGLTTVIYHLRVKSFQNFEALQLSQDRLQRELAVAGTIQRHSLPRSNPIVDGLDIAGVCISATEVGGDYYDYLELGEGKLGVLVGDVSGKGTSAALYMSKLQGIIRALKHLHHAPAQLLVAVNDLIYGMIERNSFITLTYAIFDLRERQALLCRAGHNATLRLMDHDHHLLIPRGLGLGLAPRDIFAREIEELTLPLNSHETFVFYSDGLVEARNLSGQEFGEENLVRMVAQHCDLHAEPLKQKIIEEAQKFVGYAKQHDDMTVLVAKVVA